jgi:hypothetical protein
LLPKNHPRFVEFITNNLQLVFKGVGTAIVAAIVGAWAKSYFGRKTKSEATKAGGNVFVLEITLQIFRPAATQPLIHRENSEAPRTGHYTRLLIVEKRPGREVPARD